MLIELKNLFHRTSPTLVSDAAGAIALVVLMVVGLHLPAMI